MAHPSHNEPPILIASNTGDDITINTVRGHLEQLGHRVVVYTSDTMAMGKTPMAISITQQSGLQISYNGKPFGPNAFAAAWYRRPSTFVGPNDAAKSLHIDQERMAMQSILWDSMPDERWLNPPRANRKAEEKLQQLVLAKSIGFDIPDTLITNSWQDIHDNLPFDIVLKMWRGIYYEGEEFKCLYTTPLQNTPDTLPTHTLPFPGMWQPFLKKRREWRITAVGQEIFDAAIYTSPDAKDDWRRHDSNDAVEFRSEPFPDDMKDKCLSMLDALGCRFGCFDFVEDEEGRITFLEMNPNGQYCWLEKDLGMPISKAIARELSSIAQSNT